MAQATPAFEANDGSLHRDECSAVKRDLDILIADSPLSENGPYAKIATEWLAGNAQAIGTVLMHYHDACPNDPRDEGAPESGTGPVVKGDDHAE
jgi:hypothetical protein